MSEERLTGAALIRDGVIESRGFKEHWRIRAALGDREPSVKNPSDSEGFLTSKGRFVDRYEAIDVAVGCGQLSDRWKNRPRALLSSDVNWNAKPRGRT